jgi:hypothetical protein
MYLFDAKIVAADNSGLTAGRFVFHPDPDSEIAFAVPETAIVAVEVNERVTHIRPVLQATRRWDRFFDVGNSHTVFSSEKITSHILGDWVSPGHAGALEAVWTDSVGILTGQCSGNLDDPAKSMLTSLRRLTLRTSLCDGGLHVSVIGEIGGVIFVGNTPPRATPKGRIEIEFTLSWDWIAIRGWSLIWEMPTRAAPQIKAEGKSGIENPRHFEGLVFRAPGATPLLKGSMMLDGRDPIERVASSKQCSYLDADLHEATITFSPSPTPQQLSNGLFQTPMFGPFVYFAGMGLSAIREVLSENDEGLIELRAQSLGTLTHESGDDKTVSQPIAAIRASVQRSGEGIRLHINGTLGPLKVEVHGESVAGEPNTKGVEAAEVLDIDVFIPAALVTVRGLRLGPFR